MVRVPNYSMKLLCPHCKSEEIVKHGFFSSLAHGKQQRYFCKSCDKKFIPQNAFYRMRNTPQKITLCLDLFYKGISTRQIQAHLQAFYPHNSSWVSVYSWVVKYAKIIGEFTDNLKIKSSKEIQIDEMEIGSRKSKYKGYFIDSIDIETRYMVSSEFKKNRDLKEVKQVLAKAKAKTENQLRIITSDGWSAYPKAIKKVFGYNNKLGKHKVTHKVVTASKGEGFNIWVERVHNSIRQRTRAFRGLHGSIHSAYSLMKGIEIYYNFIKKHEALNYKTPSELAIPELKFETPNRWRELIERTNTL